MMTHDDMRARTKAFAVRVIRMTTALPPGKASDVLGRQVLKSGTSIGANYREAHRASSRKQFISMMEIAQREADETLYWLELIDAAGLIPSQRLGPLMAEGKELLAILTSTVVSAKKRAIRPTRNP
jgi:four helix bundle protein